MTRTLTYEEIATALDAAKAKGMRIVARGDGDGVKTCCALGAVLIAGGIKEYSGSFTDRLGLDMHWTLSLIDGFDGKRSEWDALDAHALGARLRAEYQPEDV